MLDLPLKDYMKIVKFLNLLGFIYKVGMSTSHEDSCVGEVRGVWK